MKRQAQDQLQKPMHETPFTVNVGGRLFVTSLSTLTLSFPYSECAYTFTNLDSLAKDANGNYFIDADPDIFKHLLNVLRHPSLQNVAPNEIKKEIWEAALNHWLLSYSFKESNQYKKRRLVEVNRITAFDRALVEQLCSFVDYTDNLFNDESHSEPIPEGYFKTNEDEDGRVRDLVEYVKVHELYVMELFNKTFSDHSISFDFYKLDSLDEYVIEELTEKYKDIKKDANIMWIVFRQC